MGIVVAVAVLVTFVALAAPGRAAAVSCAAPPGPPPTDRDYRAASDVAFDGVALSGPALETGTLFSPARFLVLRYLKGKGPRVVQVRTHVRRIGEDGAQVMADFTPSIGETWRVFVHMPKGRSRVRADRLRTSICYGSHTLGSAARPIRGSARVARSGQSRWRASVARGPRGLRCLTATRTDRRARRRACERVTGGRSAVVAAETHRAGTPVASILFAASAPRLQQIEVTSAGGTHVATAAGSGRLALMAVDGDVAKGATVRLRFAGGATRVWRPAR